MPAAFSLIWKYQASGRLQSSKLVQVWGCHPQNDFNKSNDPPLSKSTVSLHSHPPLPSLPQLRAHIAYSPPALVLSRPPSDLTQQKHQNCNQQNEVISCKVSKWNWSSKGSGWEDTGKEWWGEKQNLPFLAAVNCQPPSPTSPRL